MTSDGRLCREEWQEVPKDSLSEPRPRSFGEERAGTYFAYGKECIFPLCKHRHGTGTGKWDTGVEGDNKKVNDKLVEEKRTDMRKRPEGRYFQTSSFLIF